MCCLRQRFPFLLSALLFVLGALPFSLNAQTVIDLGTGNIHGKTMDDYREEQGMKERAHKDSLAYIDHLTRAFNALHEDSLTQAETHFLKALKTRPEAPGNYVVRYNLGRIHLARNDYRGAVAYFDNVLHERPETAEARFDRAVCLYEMGNLTAALADCEVLTAHVTDAELLIPALFLKAAAHTKGHQPDLAKAELEDILRRDPNNESAALLLAGTLEDLGRPQAALDRLNLFVAAHHDNADGLIARAELQVRMGQLVAARADYDDAIRLRPNDAMLRISRAKTALALDDKTAARTDLECAVKLGVPRGELNELFHQVK